MLQAGPPEWIGFCHGYVQAVFDGVRSPGDEICAPDSLTRAKIVGAVVLQLSENPQLREFNAASVVYAVLLKTFPCR